MLRLAYRHWQQLTYQLKQKLLLEQQHIDTLQERRKHRIWKSWRKAFQRSKLSRKTLSR
jgi:hypothetical protein